MAATVRKLVVEVVEARNLVPKDGTGTSSPYARADFDGQRRKTRTVPRDLNPEWNEPLEFNFPGPGSGGVDPVAGEPLEISVFHDVRVGPSRRNNFLGRVRLDARQFVRKGEEALIYFPLEKKSFFSWVRGDIGLKVYYLDEPLAPPEPDPPAGDPPAAEVAKDAPPPDPDASPAPGDPTPVQTEEQSPPAEVPAADAAQQGAPPASDEASAEMPPEANTAAPTEDAPVMSSEALPASEGAASERPLEEETPPPPPIPTPMPRQVPVPPRPAPPPPEVPMERSKHDLVDKMPYLFVSPSI